MRVAIIVLNWNNWRDTEPCLLSLRERTYTDSTVVLVDNGSTDGSVQAAQQHFPEVVVLPLERNLGFSAGNNVGMRWAQEQGFDAVCLLNNDTTVAPDFLEPLVETLRRDRSIGATGPKIYYYSDPTLLWYAGGFIDLYRFRIWHRGIRERDSGQYDTPAEVDYLTGCCILLPCNTLEQAGLLDEGFHAYGEDCDWCRRIREQDLRLVYVPESKVWHKVSATSGGHLTWRKLRRKLAGQWQFFRRHSPWLWWAR